MERVDRAHAKRENGRGSPVLGAGRGRTTFAGLPARIADVVRGQKCRVALVSSSPAMRFVVSAFSLVNKTIRYFSPDQLREALVHLGCTPVEQVAVQQALERLTIASSQSRS